MLQVGIFLLGISASIYAAITPANSMLNWYSNDDAFFYYKIAQNVLAGHGFTFDQVNLTNGFHPLWMVVCLGVFRLSRYHLLLPLRVLIIVSGVLNGLTGIVLFRLLRKILPLASAILGASVWMLLPTIYHNYTSRGLESVLSAFFVALLILKATSMLSDQGTTVKMNCLLLGLVAALTILSRLDTLFVTLMIGFFVVFRIRKIPRMVVFDLVALLLASIIAWVIRFGTAPMVLMSYSLYPQMLLSMVLVPIALYFTGLYAINIKTNPWSFILRLFIAAVLSSVLLFGIFELLQRGGMNLLVSRSLILIDMTLTFIFIASIRFFLPPAPGAKPGDTWGRFVEWFRLNFKTSLLGGVLFSLPIALFVGGYMVINKLVFGTFTPISGQVKTWWGTLENTVYRQHDTLLGLLGFAPGRGGESPWSLATTIVADISVFLRNLFIPGSDGLPVLLFLFLLLIVFLLLVFLLTRKNALLARRSFSLLLPAIAIGCLLHIAYYAARGYGFTRSWYWVPQSMLLVLLGAVLVSRLFDKIKEWTRLSLPGNLLLVALVGTLFFMHTRFILNLCPATVPVEKQAAYLDEIKDLELHTKEGSLIGMTGGGETAYFIQHRTIVNVDGLVNSYEYFQALKGGTAHKFLDNMGLDYVFGKPFMLLESNPYQQIFSGRVAKIGMIHGASNFTLYRFGSP